MKEDHKDLIMIRKTWVVRKQVLENELRTANRCIEQIDKIMEDK